MSTESRETEDETFVSYSPSWPSWPSRLLEIWKKETEQKTSRRMKEYTNEIAPEFLASIVECDFFLPSFEVVASAKSRMNLNQSRLKIARERF
jgi:hypothetical protein